MRARFAFLFSILAFFILSTISAVDSAMPSPLEDDIIRLDGYLTITWGDAKDFRQEPLVTYSLTMTDGAEYALEVGELSPGKLLDLNGRMVQVTGRLLSKAKPSPGGPQSLLVSEVEAVHNVSQSVEQVSLAGTQRWATILCKFSDVSAEDRSLSFFQDMYGSTYPALGHFWRELSYDKINLAGSGAVGWFTLPYPRSYYSPSTSYANLTNLLSDCATAADAQLYFPDYDGLNLVFNANLDGWSWGGKRTMVLDGVSQTWGVTWLSDWAWRDEIFTVEHEMGHAFGLPHSSGQYGQTYDNRWDVMSGRVFSQPIHPLYGRYLGQHTIAYHKDRLGWLDSSQVFHLAPNSTATIALERLAQPQTDNYLMAVVPAGALQDGFYAIEARRQVGHDAILPDQGVVIYEVDRTRAIPAQVIDGDGDGDTNDAGTIWTVGESFNDPANAVTVSVDAATASGYQITITQRNFVDCASQTTVLTAECDALVALFQQTSGSNWRANDGWMVFPDVCTWAGVKCAGGHVTEVDLRGQELVGSLPAELGALTWVTYLQLSGNELSGSIPPEMGSMAALIHLDLGLNNLSGVIPPELGRLTNLRVLKLDSNDLSGAIPGEFGQLTQLREFYAGQNKLQGPLPAEMGELSRLEILYLHENELSGPVPAAFGGLTALQQLRLQRNALTALPSEMGQMSSLVELYAFNNQIAGELPPEMGRLSELQWLDLSNNHLRGGIPAELGKLANLTSLSLAANELDGPIPGEIGNLKRLSFLDLDDNHLSGPIPPELGSLSRLEVLKLAQNRLYGSLPPELGNLPRIYGLELGYNGLQGDVPAEITKLTELDDYAGVDFSFNRLSASDPDVADYLDRVDLGWDQTQTVAPENLQVEVASRVAQLTWDPILYSDGPGYYEVSAALTSGGPFMALGKTADKSNTSFLAMNLPPGETSYLVVRVFSAADGLQKNDLWSEYSTEIAVKMPAEPTPTLEPAPTVTPTPPPVSPRVLLPLVGG